MVAKMRSGCFSSQFCVHKLSETVVILLAVSFTHAGYSWSAESRPWGSGEVAAVSMENAPVFDIPPSSRGLSLLVGQTALLPCVVRNLGDKVVSWIRTKDLHILTSSVFVFTSDNRMELVHSEKTDFWGLRIRKVQYSDTGVYECQVNTDPKMNFAMKLTVADSHMHDSSLVDKSAAVAMGFSRSSGNRAAVIQGPREQYVRVGSTITFTCVATRTVASSAPASPYTPPATAAAGPASTIATSALTLATAPGGTHPAARVSREPRAQLKWTHAGRDVTFQSSRGGISVDTDYYRDERITSRLTVAMVTHEDAGNYTCRGVGIYSDVRADTVSLLVVEGEHTEAMQRDRPNGAISMQNSFLPLFFVIFNWILR